MHTTGASTAGSVTQIEWMGWYLIMGHLVMFTAGAAPSLWERRFSAATNTFIGVLLFGVVLMLLLLFGHFLAADRRSRRRDAVRRSLLEAVQRYLQADNPGKAAAVKIHDVQNLYDRRGLAVLSQTIDELDAPRRQALQSILLNIGFAGVLSKQLDTTNEDYLVELIRLVGELDLVGLDSRIVSLLYTHKDNVELQFQAFLALSRLGSREHILRVCMDESYVQTLSFRSLQQVLTSYSGDKADLYAVLLASPDPYVTRVSIKQVGLEGLEDLAGQVAPWMESDNINLAIDAARTVGLLGYQPAVPRLLPLLRHDRWEVRGVAVTALAAIDRDGHVDQLVAALQDSEWQVRYNAALALQNVPDPGALRRQIEASEDRYALEMYDYMAQAAKIWRQPQ